MNCPDCGGAIEARAFQVRRDFVIVLWVVGVVLAYFLTGSLLHDFLEGIRRSTLPLWKVWFPVAVLGAGVVSARVRLGRWVCQDCGRGSPDGRLFVAVSEEKTKRFLAASPTRRRVLRILGSVGATAAAGAAGAAAAVGRNHGWVPVVREFFLSKVETSAPSVQPGWQGAEIKKYRRLGRTNVMVSDISFGSGSIDDLEVARRALERGVNYFDTAPDYAETGSERLLGEVLRERRERVFLATKFCVADGHLPDDTPVPKIIDAVEASLRRLQTDYVDLIHIHACDRLDRLMAPNIHEAFDRLKEQGKVRFLGVSSHAPNLEEVANTAVDSGRFDVMMLAYNFGMWERLGPILDKARANDVGVVAMKTLRGARHKDLTDFRDDASSYSQAAFRWVLSNPSVSCLVISFSKLQHVDEYLHASGTALTPSDVELLRRYEKLTAADYCMPHCGDCLRTCRRGLPINDILRYRMYFRDYGWEKEGMRLYAALALDGRACADCTAPCTGACPAGIPIREKMLDAHRRLSWGVRC